MGWLAYIIEETWTFVDERWKRWSRLPRRASTWSRVRGLKHDIEAQIDHLGKERARIGGSTLDPMHILQRQIEIGGKLLAFAAVVERLDKILGIEK